MNAVAIVISMVIICFNGCFVALEFGLIGSQRSRIEARAEAGSRAARSALKMQADIPTTLGGAQLGNTLCSIALGWLAEPAVSELLESALSRWFELPSGVLHTIGFVVALSLVAVVHMVLGEMVPKNLALIGPEMTLLVLARPIAAYLIVARPIGKTLLRLSNFLLSLVGVKPALKISESVTPDQFLAMVSESAESELVDDQAPVLVKAALEFEATAVGKVMTPIDQAAAVQLGQSLAEVGREFASADTSRLLVYDQNRTDVQGFVHCNDLVAAASGSDNGRGSPDFRGVLDSTRLSSEHLREVVKVDAKASLFEAVTAMRTNNVNLLLVTADSAGVPQGCGVIQLARLIDRLKPTSTALSG